MMIKVNTSGSSYVWVNSSLVVSLQTISGQITVTFAGNSALQYSASGGGDSLDTVAGNINAVTNTVTLANDISLTTTGTLS